MELQGLQEALKVEIQCHQVKETSYYYTVTALMNESEPEKSDGIKRETLAFRGNKCFINTFHLYVWGHRNMHFE